jgi:hypothetical protein
VRAWKTPVTHSQLNCLELKQPLSGRYRWRVYSRSWPLYALVQCSLDAAILRTGPSESENPVKNKKPAYCGVCEKAAARTTANRTWRLFIDPVTGHGGLVRKPPPPPYEIRPLAISVYYVLRRHGRNKESLPHQIRSGKHGSLCSFILPLLLGERLIPEEL